MLENGMKQFEQSQLVAAKERNAAEAARVRAAQAAAETRNAAEAARVEELRKRMNANRKKKLNGQTKEMKWVNESKLRKCIQFLIKVSETLRNTRYKPRETWIRRIKFLKDIESERENLGNTDTKQRFYRVVKLIIHESTNSENIKQRIKECFPYIQLEH